jgi:hypothetical protein
MTLFLIYIMFLSIMFLVYFRSKLDIVIVDTKFMHKIAKRLAQYSSGLSVVDIHPSSNAYMCC